MSSIFFFQAEDGIRDLVRSRGLGDVYKRQVQCNFFQNLLSLNKKVVIISFENPYVLSNFPNAENYICTYSDSKSSQRAVLNILNGSLRAKGRLPISIPNTDFKVGYKWNPDS